MYNIYMYTHVQSSPMCAPDSDELWSLSGGRTGRQNEQALHVSDGAHGCPDDPGKAEDRVHEYHDAHD